jgi:methionyl-tRNA synthetase
MIIALAKLTLYGRNLSMKNIFSYIRSDIYIMTNSTNNKKREILVTSALPYANGNLHLGHILEHIQSDIWVRAQRLRGNEVQFICGSDAHGTPIMLSARARGIEPETLVAEFKLAHEKDLRSFLVEYDNFYTTHSVENETIAGEIFAQLQANDDIAVREVMQAYDTVENMFLPDRFVKGTCPKCAALAQYGDNCEVCGAHFSPTDLIDPVSVLSNTTPIVKASEHYFFKLSKYAAKLSQWLDSGSLQEEVRNKLYEWLNSGLSDWDISRDAPYFGFKIPGSANKYFYVWLDAPIGYMASFKNLVAKTNPQKFAHYWQAGATTELYHFIGKDIVYFHGLFWPAMLMGSNHRTPSKLCVHGFLTVNGEKMSKSRGTFITAQQYLAHLPPELLRYYFATKLTNKFDDLDFNLSDFVLRVNAELLGKFVNIASRCAVFVQKYFNNTLSANIIDNNLWSSLIGLRDEIFELFEERQYAKATKMIMQAADEVNKFIDSHKPWLLIKNEATHTQTLEVCSLAINAFKVLMTYLSPILPNMAQATAAFLNVELTFKNVHAYLGKHIINHYIPLLQRLEQLKVDAIMENNNLETTNATVAVVKDVTKEVSETSSPLITIDDFAKIDLRIVEILNAEAIPEADKLIKLTLSLGAGNTRQVFAGIKSAYEPAQLIGKYTVMVANLAPRKMKFGISEGMVLAASSESASGLWLLEPHAGARPGMRVK